MSIETPADLEGLRRAGRVVARIIRELRALARPGVTTAALDRRAEAILLEAGARSAPRLEYGFPGSALLSVNEEAVHGVPRETRVLRGGDVLKIDVTVELGGYVADAAETVVLEPAGPGALALCEGTRAALERALAAARAGRSLSAIGVAVETEARRRGLSVLRALMGHGVGRRIHEPPHVPNWADPRAAGTPLTEGLVLAIEPILALSGSGAVLTERDGWTIRTADRSPAAHFEHTVVVTRERPIVLTAA